MHRKIESGFGYWASGSGHISWCKQQIDLRQKLQDSGLAEARSPIAKAPRNYED